MLGVCLHALQCITLIGNCRSVQIDVYVSVFFVAEKNSLYDTCCFLTVVFECVLLVMTYVCDINFEYTNNK